MTPLNQGMYEFKSDSLLEVRKCIGITQSKMAELLGIPANTLSRWETGITVPDASALAAIYSLAKEHGISEMPPFFGIRKNSQELKIGSKPSNQSVDSLSFYQSLQNYLNTQIELIGTEQPPVIKVEVRNTAPIIPDWPKIVFTGVGLNMAHIGGETQAFLPSRLKTKIIKKPEEKPTDVGGTPWQHDSKRENLLKIQYTSVIRQDVSHQEFPDITSDESRYGEVLFPGQSVIYEMEITSELLPYLHVKVAGTVSRRHLFHYEEIFPMPENITKPLAISAFNDFWALNLDVPLMFVIQSMPNFDSSTRLEEVQNFAKVLSDGIVRIKATQDELNNVFRQHKIYWFRAHLRSAFIFLDRVNAAFVRMQDAIRANSSDKIAAESSAIKALTGELTQIDGETQELMHKHNISEEELVGRSTLNEKT